MQFLHTLADVRCCLRSGLLATALAGYPAAASALPITGVNLGVAEKGLILGVEANPGGRDQLELGLQFAQGQPAQIDAGLSDAIPVEVFSGGVRLAYNRYLFGRADQAGPFVQAALSAQRLAARSVVDLETLNFQVGDVTITCSTCGTVTFRTRSPALSVVPAVGVGWQAILSQRLRLKALVGVQYYDVPTVSWSSERTLPKFARDEMRAAQRLVNLQIEGLSDVYPTAGVLFTYLF
jgi:hypothetical protein